jgi:hypothetical protein
MDGTHWIPIEGAPDLVDSIKLADTAGFAGWSTAPVPLPPPYSCVVGTRRGRIYIFGDKGELRSTIEMPEREFVDQLLTTNGTIIAIAASGAIRAYSFDGKQLWAGGTGLVLTGNAVMVNGLLVLPTSSGLIANKLRDGREAWRVPTAISCVSLAVSRDLEWIAAGLSFNESGRADSVLAIKALTGVKGAELVLEAGRITSNIAIATHEADLLLAGTLGADSGDGRSGSLVAVKDWTSRPRVVWSKRLPYIVLSVSVNSDKAFASGFRNSQGELISGIDVFKLGDSSFQWKRRFSEPLLGAVAVSEANLFFGLSFETEAIVGSHSLFYTLRSGSGQTVSERPLKASSGMLPVMPMPDDQGRFLLCDRSKPVIYALDRSTLKRVF